MFEQHVKDLIVNRHYITVADVLYKEEINCIPVENYAAKIFIKFLKEHPEYSEDDVDLRIDYVDEEEDHYGNGGGRTYTAVIFKRRQETDKEHAARIQELEDRIIFAYTNYMRTDLSCLLNKLNIQLIPKDEQEAFLQKLYRNISSCILTEIDKVPYYK